MMESDVRVANATDHPVLEKKTYTAPQLIIHGTLANLTQGGAASGSDPIDGS